MHPFTQGWVHLWVLVSSQVSEPTLRKQDNCLLIPAPCLGSSQSACCSRSPWEFGSTPSPSFPVHLHLCFHLHRGCLESTLAPLPPHKIIFHCMSSDCGSLSDWKPWVIFESSLVFFSNVFFWEGGKHSYQLRHLP